MKLLNKGIFVLFAIFIYVAYTMLCVVNVTAIGITDSGMCGDNLTWTLYDDGKMIVDGQGKMWDWKNISNLPWDAYNGFVKDLIIEKDVLSIGDYAFSDFDALENVIVGDSVISIGNSTFSFCDNLENVSMGKSVTSIGQFAFSHCDNLTSIILGNKLTFVDSFAFSNCNNLMSATVLSNNVVFDSFIFSNSHAAFTMFGYFGGTVEQYAIKNGHSFIDYASYIAGDITRDSLVDINDAMRLFLFTMLPNQYPISYPDSVDFTKDGSVDIADAILLFMHSMLPDMYPLG